MSRARARLQLDGGVRRGGELQQQRQGARLGDGGGVGLVAREARQRPRALLLVELVPRLRRQNGNA